GLTREMVVGEIEKSGPQLGEVRKLAVESQPKPFPFAAVLPFERLGVAQVVGAAGCVTHMADGGAAGVLAHDIVVFRMMIEAEGLDHGADLLVGIENALAARIVGRETRG